MILERDIAQDALWMALALKLAGEGLGRVEPNPMVGCVLVSQTGVELGRGFHAKFGDAHAEVAAIANAVARGNESQLAGATAYVTLEPCCHFGKTPPCTEALLRSGVRRVVVATLDPYPEVAGQGCAILRQHGVQVDVGLAQQAAQQLNAPYYKRQELNLPWVIAKWAMSLDGKIATRTGHSRWISCPESRAYVHHLRGRVDAIMIGIGTLLADDPLLTARDTPICRRALRVVADSSLRLPVTSRLVQTAGEYPTLIIAGPGADASKRQVLEDSGLEILVCQDPQRPARLLEALYYLSKAKAVTNLLVEGGSELLGGFADVDQLDQLEVFLAPRILGGVGALSPIAGCGIEEVPAAPGWCVAHSQLRGIDLHLTCSRAGTRKAATA